jgi:hypothetical protein
MALAIKGPGPKRKTKSKYVMVHGRGSNYYAPRKSVRKTTKRKSTKTKAAGIPGWVTGALIAAGVVATAVAAIAFIKSKGGWQAALASVGLGNLAQSKAGVLPVSTPILSTYAQAMGATPQKSFLGITNPYIGAPVISVSAPALAQITQAFGQGGIPIVAGETPAQQQYLADSLAANGGAGPVIGSPDQAMYGDMVASPNYYNDNG